MLKKIKSKWVTVVFLMFAATQLHAQEFSAINGVDVFDANNIYIGQITSFDDHLTSMVLKFSTVYFQVYVAKTGFILPPNSDFPGYYETNNCSGTPFILESAYRPVNNEVVKTSVFDPVSSDVFVISSYVQVSKTLLSRRDSINKCSKISLTRSVYPTKKLVNLNTFYSTPFKFMPSIP